MPPLQWPTFTPPFSLYKVGVTGRVNLNKNDTGLMGHVDGVLSYGGGTNDIERNVVASGIGLNTVQAGKTDISGLNGLLRATLDGSNGNAWAVTPFVQAGFDTLKQNALALGNGVSGLTVDEVASERVTLGYGATLTQPWAGDGYLQLTGTGMHHSGDTNTSLISQFSSAGGLGASFVTSGDEVRNQYLVNVGIGKSFGGGWIGSLDGFGEFGDLNGYGVQMKVAKRF